MSGYGQTVFSNGSAPPINAENLNKSEAGVNAALGYDSLQEIRDLGAPSNSVETVYARGHTVCSDGGAGTFHWLANSTLDDDDGAALLPTGHSGPGRWVREVSDHLTPQMFGAVADAVWTGTDWTGTNASPAIQAADDAAQIFNVPVFFPNGKYYVVESILKNPGVDWISQSAAWIDQGDELHAASLCPSHTLTSVRDATTGKFSNGVIDVDQANTGYFSQDVKINGINIAGCPSNVSDYSYQCPRAGYAIQNSAAFRINANIQSMKTAIGTGGWIDSSFKGQIKLCGSDADGDPTYALDLRTDFRVENGDPGFGEGEWEIRGVNALEISGRMVNCQLWWDINSFNSSGGIRFRDWKVEEFADKIDRAAGRNTIASRIRSRTGDVYFGRGCSFRSFNDAKAKWLMEIANSRTIYSNVAFLTNGRFVYGIGSGVVINGFTSQLCQADYAIFTLPADSTMTNGKITQDITGLTDRKFANITGNNVKISGLHLISDGTPDAAGISSGPLFLILAGLTGVDIEYSIDDEEYEGRASTLSGGTGEFPKEYLQIEVKKQGATKRIWTDADWAVDGEIYSAANAIIRQRRRGEHAYLFNAQTTPCTLTKVIQGYYGEKVLLGLDPASVDVVTILSNDFIKLTGGLDAVLGTDADFIALECVDGDIWVETGRG